MGELIQLLLPVVIGIGGAIAGIKFVSEGERALLLRFDKAVKRGGEYKVIMPGLRFLIPGAHKLARIHVRQRTINFPSQTIVLKDRTVFEVSAVLLCRVKDSAQDLYNALFETTGINTALSDFGMIVIREVVGERSYDDLFGESRAEVAAELVESIQKQADEWGIEVIKFELSDCKPNAETARMIQTSAQASFRINALKEAAKEMGYSDVRQLGSTLSSVLVGIPLVATAGNDVVTEIGEVVEES